MKAARDRVQQRVKGGRVGYALHREGLDVARSKKIEFDAGNGGRHRMRRVHGDNAARAAPTSAMVRSKQQKGVAWTAQSQSLEHPKLRGQFFDEVAACQAARLPCALCNPSCPSPSRHSASTATTPPPPPTRHPAPPSVAHPTAPARATTSCSLARVPSRPPPGSPWPSLALPLPAVGAPSLRLQDA